MMKKNTLLFFCLVLLLTALTGMARAQEQTTQPIRIEADRMESAGQGQVITFSGHVEAKQGDLLIHADTMTVTYVRSQTAKNSGKSLDETTPGKAALPGTDPGRDISKLTAEGHVEITRQDWRAVGDRLEYFSTEKKIIMTGNQAKAWQGKNMVSGERIVLFLDKGKSIVERSGKQGERVKAFIYPQGESPKE